MSRADMRSEFTPQIINEETDMDLPENIPQSTTEEDVQAPPEPGEPTEVRRVKTRSVKPWWIVVVLLTYLIGLGSGYGVWGRPRPGEEQEQAGVSELQELAEQVNPPEGYTLPVTFDNLGPQMVGAGIINRDLFIRIYEQAGQPLTDEQLGMLDGTHQGEVVINHTNAYFLLNFLWALGLANQNPILESGPIQQNGEAGVEGLASTGGWTLATRPVREIISRQKLIALTPEQQKRVEAAAAAVYRPCCDNPTHFPDCNHGMAMLGLLELMASQEVRLEDMLEAAKYTNAFWYPQQTLEQAVYFLKAEGQEYQDVEARMILGPQYSSGSGFAGLHQFLGSKGWLPQAPNSGGSCGV